MHLKSLLIVHILSCFIETFLTQWFHMVPISSKMLHIFLICAALHKSHILLNPRPLSSRRRQHLLHATLYKVLDLLLLFRKKLDFRDSISLIKPAGICKVVVQNVQMPSKRDLINCSLPACERNLTCDCSILALTYSIRDWQFASLSLVVVRGNPRYLIRSFL